MLLLLHVPVVIRTHFYFVVSVCAVDNKVKPAVNLLLVMEMVMVVVTVMVIVMVMLMVMVVIVIVKLMVVVVVSVLWMTKSIRQSISYVLSQCSFSAVTVFLMCCYCVDTVLL
jgi:hypothetical protein